MPHPVVDTRVDHPDFSYLEDQGPVDPTVYGNDAYIGEDGPHVIPLLTEEDGMRLGPDGKLHFVGIDAVSPDVHDARHLRSGEQVPHEITPGTLAVHGLGRVHDGGRVYRGSGHPHRPLATHRA